MAGCGEPSLDHDAKVPQDKRFTPPDPSAPPGTLHEAEIHRLLTLPLDGYTSRDKLVSPTHGQMTYEREDDSGTTRARVTLRVCDSSIDNTTSMNADALEAISNDVRSRFPPVHRDNPGLQWGMSPFTFDGGFKGIMHWYRSYVGPDATSSNTSSRRSSLLAYSFQFADGVNGIDITVTKPTRQTVHSLDELKNSLREEDAIRTAHEVFRVLGAIFQRRQDAKSKRDDAKHRNETK